MSILVSFVDGGGSRLTSVSDPFIELKLKFRSNRVSRFLDRAGDDEDEEASHGLNSVSFMTLSSRKRVESL